MMRMRVIAVSFAAVVCLPSGAAGQDLSRYRDVPFGSTVASVVSVTRTAPDALKVIHARPALIQELKWRPQYALGRPAGVDPAQEITFRFYDDQLFAVTVVYEARLVGGLTNDDLIEAVSAVYGAATRTAAASRGAAQTPAGAINSSTAIASWQTTDYQFTLMREIYPATFRLIGVSKRLEPLARDADSTVNNGAVSWVDTSARGPRRISCPLVASTTPVPAPPPIAAPLAAPSPPPRIPPMIAPAPMPIFVASSPFVAEAMWDSGAH